MTGRGIDQILSHPGDPAIPERYVRDARDYVALAERVSGPIPWPVDPAYVWGDALSVLDSAGADARIVNLETSVTGWTTPWPLKDIAYRMHPANVGCLTAAGLDVCTLANNHVLDYGEAGMCETIATLAAAGIRCAGAGENLAEAQRPAIVGTAGGVRIVVLAFGTSSSGIPPAWAATATKPGVHRLADLAARTAGEVVRLVRAVKRAGDVVIGSIHWGSNWGYEVPRAHVRFAHRLIDGGVDLVYGHSSHHPRPIEVHRGKLILYGCGDFLDDYEGIGGYEGFRGDLVLMYLPTLDGSTGCLKQLRLVPMRLRGMRLCRPSDADLNWLRTSLDRMCEGFGTRLDPEAADGFALRWAP